MIKRTPQEIADFYQCYVAEDRDYNVFKLYKEEPRLNPPDCICDWDGDSFSQIDSTDINVTPEHVWCNIYAPKSAEIREQIMNQIEEKMRELERAFESSYKEIFSTIPKTLLGSVGGAETERTTKAPHQSEVHTHPEYTVEHSYQLDPLISRIKCLMNDGWKPQGGIEVEHLPKSEGYPDYACYYYQAMVRSV